MKCRSHTNMPEILSKPRRQNRFQAVHFMSARHFDKGQHLWNSSEREWREPKGCAGIASSRQSESNHGRLYASRQSAEERSPEQAGEDGHEKDRLIVTGPNWTIRKAAVLRKFFILLASPTGFEPVLPP